MANRYASTGVQTALGTADDFMLSVTGQTTTSVEVYYLLYATEGTPIDEMSTFSVHRCTDHGTGADVMPEGLNELSVARIALADSTEEHTVDPTTTGIPLIEVPIHTRATFQWQVPPGMGMGFQGPLAADDGFAFSARAPTYAAVARTTAFHEE